MPVIGITASSKPHDCVESVQRAGGEAWLLDPAQTSAQEVFPSLDGLLLGGGGDVDPARYGEPLHPRASLADPVRDRFEIELVARALEADIPVLGLCRGLQVLNVAAGGSLVQDIPSELAAPLGHALSTSPVAIAHEVLITRSSLLWRLLEEQLEDGDRLAVNSRHHQAVKALAPRFNVAATAPDGVVEAIELPGARFCLAVQWHPENFYRTGEFQSIFEGFVRASRASRESRDLRRDR